MPSERRQSDAAARLADTDKKDKSEKKDKKEKKDKSEKKEKKDKSEKKERKEKKEKRKSLNAAPVDETGSDVDVSMADVTVTPSKSKSKKRDAASEQDTAMADDTPKAKKVKKTTTVEAEEPYVRYVVPFAEPLGTDDETAKVFEAVRRASRNRALLTGIKETQKYLRKNTPAPASSAGAVLILAADTYPWDIISHMPVLAEEAGVPVIYVRSREKLGRASGSNRIQTSAMLVLGAKPTGAKAKKDKDGSKKDGELSADEYGVQFGRFSGLIKSANERVTV